MWLAVRILILAVRIPVLYKKGPLVCYGHGPFGPGRYIAQVFIHVVVFMSGAKGLT